MGLDFCDSLQSGAVSLEGGLGKVRGREVERGREAETRGRVERTICLKRDILVVLGQFLV